MGNYGGGLVRGLFLALTSRLLDIVFLPVGFIEVLDIFLSLKSCVPRCVPTFFK